MRYSTNQKSVQAISQTLMNFEKKMQRKIMRKALRKLGERLALRIRSNIFWNSKKLRRAVKTKVKSYKRGRVIWCGTGFLNNNSDDWRLKVKAHAYNNGWTPYPKGRPTNRQGKGWRKGLRRLGGSKIYQTEFVTKVYRDMKPMAQDMLYESVVEAIKELSAT